MTLVRTLPLLVACSGSGLGSPGATSTSGGVPITCKDPDGAMDDADGDGICDFDDKCDGHDDHLDADDDLNPDDCDPCPLDRFDDADLDDICDSDDVCPGFPDADFDGDGVMDGCTGHTVHLRLAVDATPGQSTWSFAVSAEDVTGVDGLDLLGSGGFSTPNQTLEQDVIVPPGQFLCVELLDAASDGGVSGDASDDTLGVQLWDWRASDWTDRYMHCHEVSDE